MSLSVVIAFDSFYDGGAEMFAIRLANALSIQNQVTLLEIRPYNTSRKHQLKLVDKRVKLVQLGKSFLGNLVFKQGQFHGKAKVIQLHKWTTKRQLEKVLEVADIVSSHSWQSDVFLLENASHIKLVSSFHGHYELLKDLPGYEIITENTLKRTCHVVYITKKHLETLQKFNFPLSKTSRIFYGIDEFSQGCLTEFNSGDQLELIFIGRGIKEKGWEEAIKAFLQLDKVYPGQLRIRLLGEGSFLDDMKAKYRHPSLFFHGFQTDVIGYIFNAHIGILPSYYAAESFPNAVIEFLLCGKPVIATNMGAIPEMLETEGKTAGTIIDCDGESVDIQKIVNAIESYLKEPDLVARQSALALKAARKFSMDKCANAYSELFQKLV